MIRWPPSHSFTFKFLASWFQIRSVLLFDTNCWNVRNVSTTPVFIKARRKSFVSTIMANEDYNIPGARKRSSLLKPWIGNMREGGEGREIDREGERERQWVSALRGFLLETSCVILPTVILLFTAWHQGTQDPHFEPLWTHCTSVLFVGLFIFLSGPSNRKARHWLFGLIGESLACISIHFSWLMQVFARRRW